MGGFDCQLDTRLIQEESSIEGLSTSGCPVNVLVGNHLGCLHGCGKTQAPWEVPLPGPVDPEPNKRKESWPSTSKQVGMYSFISLRLTLDVLCPGTYAPDTETSLQWWSTNWDCNPKHPPLSMLLLSECFTTAMNEARTFSFMETVF